MHDRPLVRSPDAGWWVAAVLPVLVVLVLLVPVVDVDPATGVTFSNSPFTDEAWNVQNARDWALFGTPATNEWTLWVLTLPFTLVETVAFRLFGVGIVQARLVDVLCVAATVGLLGIGLARPFGRPAAFVAALAYGTSTLVLYYGRLAYLEPMAGLCLAAGTLALLHVDGERPGRWGLAAGAALALAVGTKGTVLPGALAVLGVAALAAIRSPAARRWTAGAGAAFAASALFWIGAIWLPNPRAVGNVIHHIYPRPLPVSLDRLVARAAAYPFASNDGALRQAFPLFLTGLGGVAVAVAGFRPWSLGARLVILASAAAFAVGLLATVLFVGQANRYVVVLLPWLAILTAPLAATVIGRAGRIGPGGAERRPLRTLLVTLALAGALGVQGVAAHQAWMAGATRELVVTQDRVARALPPDAVVAGGYAPLLAMTSTARTIVPCCGTSPVNRSDLYATAGARYWAHYTPPRWAAAHPAEWAARTPVACLTWARVRRELCVTALP